MNQEERRRRPIPYPSALSKPFWDACREHELVLQCCTDCDTTIFYPRATCPSCGSGELAFRVASGRGTVHTFTIARRPTHPRLVGQVPYVIAIVQLDEGPRLTSSVVGCDPDDVRIGQEVIVAFEDIDDEDVSVPVFRPVP